MKKKIHVIVNFFQRSWKVYLYNTIVWNVIWIFNKRLHNNENRNKPSMLCLTATDRMFLSEDNFFQVKL